MPQYKYYYFGVYSRGEAPRILLNHAGVQFENVVVDFPSWPDLKPGMPNQQIPALELQDGTRLGQSRSIVRYLAAQHGYVPADPILAAKADELTEAYIEVIENIYKPAFIPEDQKEAQIKKNFEEILPKFLDYIEPITKRGTKFLVTETLTAADFWIGSLYTNYFTNKAVGYGADKWAPLLAKYPGFKAFGERFAAENAKYLQSRAAAPV